MKGLSKIYIFLILTITISLLLPFSSHADNGDGSGGGHDNPFALVSSYPSNGQKDVALPVEIKLSFSKNVINMSVKDNNQKCFSLQSSDGKVIPIEVIMADDQIEPEKKRDVLLKPLQKLNPGIGYTVKIAAGLMSKSGVTLGKTVAIIFETRAEAVSTVIEKSNPVTENSQVTGNTANSTENTAVEKTSNASGNTTSPDTAATGKNNAVKVDGSVTKTAIQETEGATQVTGVNKQDTKEPAENQPATMQNENKQNGKSYLVLTALGIAIILAALYTLIKHKGKQR